MQAALRSVLRSGRGAVNTCFANSLAGNAREGITHVSSFQVVGASTWPEGTQSLGRMLGLAQGGGFAGARAFGSSTFARMPIEDFFTTMKDPKDEKPITAGAYPGEFAL